MTCSNERCKLSLSRLQGYSDMGRYALQPLSYETLDYASGFASEQCPEGFCAVSRNTLRILTLERLGEAFNQQVPHCCLCHEEYIDQACPWRPTSQHLQRILYACTGCTHFLEALFALRRLLGCATRHANL